MKFFAHRPSGVMKALREMDKALSVLNYREKVQAVYLLKKALEIDGKAPEPVILSNRKDDKNESQ